MDTTEKQTGLLLLGIGGGGCRLVSQVVKRTAHDIRAICVDTDSQTDRQDVDEADRVPFKLIGGSRLSGHGAGGDPIAGRAAAQDDLANLLALTQDIRMVIVVTCLGGGTGSGASGEIVKKLHDNGFTTLCLVTKPFAFEGKVRKQTADRYLPMIEEHASSLCVISLDDLFQETGEDILERALAAADKQLCECLALLWKLLYRSGFIRINSENLHNLASHGGHICMGYGCAAGEGRAKGAVAALKQNRLLQRGETLSKANALILGILAGSDLRLSEIGEIMADIAALCPANCDIQMGTVQDESYSGSIELVAMVFDSWTVVREQPPIATDIPVRVNPRAKKNASGGSKLGFGPHGRGRFENVETTTFQGEDLDVPTYVRRGMTLET
ncbi:MAG: hypothetical protein IJR99_16385 [Kiritimatiellae bacterium]|nr:hypothetical protein [Kiritimatiellia bacterium]